MQTALSEAAERNKHPILEKLCSLLSSSTSILEIGSGTGQHAIHFAHSLPHLLWQPTELPDKLPALSHLCRNHPSDNLAQPIMLDIDDDPWPTFQADAVFTANTLHIVHWQQVQRLFIQVDQLLPENGLFCIYGPFNHDGHYNSESNRQFDRWLKNRDPGSGIRDITDLSKLAESCDLLLKECYTLPANNCLLVWHKHKPTHSKYK